MHLPVKGNQINIRKNKFSNTMGWVRKKADGSAKVHQGWDISADLGTPVYAITNGVIEFVTGNVGDYGRQICLSFYHQGKQLYAFYAHLREVTVVKGQFVGEGEDIGLVGRTGNAGNLPMSETHLHFEIRTSPRPGGVLKGRLDPATIFGMKPILDTMLFKAPQSAN